MEGEMICNVRVYIMCEVVCYLKVDWDKLKIFTVNSRTITKKIRFIANNPIVKIKQNNRNAHLIPKENRERDKQRENKRKHITIWKI